MPIYNDVFRRVEKKYRVSSAQRAGVIEGISGMLSSDTFGLSRITSVYLDTPNYDIVNRSLEKPLYKEKLRLRTYGVDSGDALIAAFDPAHSGVVDDSLFAQHSVFFELKKKYKGVVYKRRIALSLAAARAYVRGVGFEEATRIFPLEDDIDSASFSARRIQIAREIDACFDRWSKPTARVVVACDRIAYEPVDKSEEGLAGLRITFDNALSYRALVCDPPMETPEAIIGKDESIMEVKCAFALPLRLCDVMTDLRIFPQSFTKYGMAYRLMMRDGYAGILPKGVYCA